MPVMRRRRNSPGCWTCRSRRLKCDERKPTCERCEKAGLQCGGYDLRLSWTSNRNILNFKQQKTLGKRSPQRSPRPSPDSPSLPEALGSTTTHSETPPTGGAATPRDYLSSVEEEGSPTDSGFEPLLTERFATDNETIRPQAQTVAPSFSPQVPDEDINLLNLSSGQPLFTSNSILDSHPGTYSFDSFQSMNENLLELLLAGASRSPAHHLCEVREPDPIPDYRSLYDAAHATSTMASGQPATIVHTALDGPVESDVQQELVTSDVALYGTSSCSETTQPGMKDPNGSETETLVDRTETPVLRARGNNCLKLRHLDVLPDLGIERQLIQHWLVHLCDALNPLPGIHNPLRTVLMPIAWEGAQSHANTSSGATALFHLICSTSASHLAIIKKEDASRGNLRALAFMHLSLGLSHLRQNMPSDDKRQCEALLSSLIMCIFHEIVCVSGSAWRVHLRGAIAWARRIRPEVWTQSHSSSVIYQMFTGLTTILESQFLPSDRSALHFSDMGFLPGTYALETAVGLSKRTLHHILWTNRTSTGLDANNEQYGGEGSEITTREWDSMELELFMSVPDASKLSDTDKTTHAIYHYEFLFYYAAITYFKRTLRRCPVEEVQCFVEQSIEHMELLLRSITGPFSPLMWPIAVLGFEATGISAQERITAFLDTLAERSGLMLWSNLGILVRKFWVIRREKESSNLAWQDFLTEPAGASVMLF